MHVKKLVLGNVSAARGRTAGLAVLVALLAFVAFGGGAVVFSLQNGLGSLEARLGADIVVAPKTARSTTNLEQVLLDGVPGSFYMDAGIVNTLAQVEGVQQVSPQYYLATAKASCCALPVQIIGIDPATDFTIQPWIARSVGTSLARGDVVTGCKVSGAPGSTILLYGKECRIVGRLDETGTALDTAIYATGETVQDLIAGSIEQGLSVLSENDPASVVSTVQVKVAQGYTVEQVTNDMNLHVRGVWATASRALTAGVADSIGATSRLIGGLVVALWVLALMLLVVAFVVVGRSRTREFAVLRTLGASRASLSRVVFAESALTGAIGAAVGIALAAFLLFALGSSMEEMLGLPFLMPGAGALAGFAVAVFALCVLACALASAVSARRLSSVDPGLALREV